MGVPRGTKAYPLESLEELVVDFDEGGQTNGKVNVLRTREESSSVICSGDWKFLQ